MNSYYISTEKSLLNINKIWILLTECFWSKNIPIEYVDRFIKFSLCFGVYQYSDNQLIGFGRVISDYTTYAYICDIIVDSDHRGKGVASTLIRTIMSHDDLQGLKTWSLRTTEEARSIYLKNEFKLADYPDTLLEKNNLNIYSCHHFVNLYKNKST